MKPALIIILILCTLTLLASPLTAVASAPAGTAPMVPVIPAAPASDLAAAQEVTGTLPVTGTQPMTGTVRIATLVATYFDRSVEEILALHAQDMGFGSIAKALFTAAEANTTLEAILAMRLQGLGWGEIRMNLGLPAGMPHKSLGQIVSQGSGNKGPEWAPPGQARKGTDFIPPGQAKKVGKSNLKGPKKP